MASLIFRSLSALAAPSPLPRAFSLTPSASSALSVLIESKRNSPPQYLRSYSVAATMKEGPALPLSAEETTLFATIVRALEGSGRRDIVVRVAGGWVRDKLLERATSHVDIDLAVDGVTGEELCAILATHVDPSAKIAVVKQNPQQSKHLRTAIMVLCGFELNVNHLRSEHYASDSRIPLATPPAEPSVDAQRRDFTVNALYYNIHSGTRSQFSSLCISEVGI